MTIFTVFYVDQPGQPSRVEEYLEYIKIGQEVLEHTNPGATYAVLTDKQTLPLLKPHCHAVPTAPEEGPLMYKYLRAQAEFLRYWPVDDLIILAATDCLANRSLILAPNVGFATTYNKSKRINNVGYVRDKELGYWLLLRAITALTTLSAEEQEWFGDQRAWEAAIGPWLPAEGMIHQAKPEGRLIHLLPCSTHNRFVRRNGTVKGGDAEALILHFKGQRKEHMRQYAEQNILGRNIYGLSLVRGADPGKSAQKQTRD